MKKLLLIDGNSMLFRAYHGLKYTRGLMQSSSGVPTNAVYGFSTMLNKALEMMQPTHVLIAFDTGKPTFRHEMFDDYKGTRTEVDPDLVSQFELVREFLDSYPMTRIELDGYEADDIIGTLAKHSVDYHVEILTSDRDMLQLIDDHVDVLLMKKGITEMEHMTKASLFDEMGITPDQIVDLKAMMGDTADNIPGIPSVGEKTALKYIKLYQSLDGLYEHANEIKGKVGERVRENEALARMSYDLAKINTQVPLDIQMDDLVYEIPNDTLNAFYRRYDMNSLIRNDVETAVVAKKEIIRKDLIVGEEAITMGIHLHEVNGKIQGAFVSDGTSVSYFNADAMISNKNFLTIMYRGTFIALQSKKLYLFMRKHGIKICRELFDPLLLAFVIDSSVTTVDKFKDAYDLWFHEYEGVEQEEALAIALLDTHKKMINIAKSMGVYEVFTEIEAPLTWVLAEMEYEGIFVDASILKEIEEKTFAKMEALKEEVFMYAGEEFNLNSPKQLGEILFDKLEIPTKKKRSTAVGVLEELAPHYPIIQPILEYRKYSKLYSTYAVGLAKFIEEDGKIHTDYNQHAVATGRLSSKDPNLQNISVRDEETRMVRSAFKPSPGNKLVSIDYSQIELRILSYIAQEEAMIQTFKNHEDIHVQTAAKIFHTDEVTSEMRRSAKSVNFGIIYGMSGFGLGKQLDISVGEANGFIKRYNEIYPKISEYMDEVVEECEADGYVTTLFGRRRYIPEIHSSNRAIKDFGRRAAMNAPIQGTAADIIKLAMLKVADLIACNEYKSKMILQVHDELVFDVYPDEQEKFIKEVVEVMENVVDWRVKLEVSVEIADDWMGNNA